MGPTTWIRGKVSKKKRRFNEDGFDLDLTYINDDIVAMGFPSESVEGVYRNNMKEVQRFFDKRHGKNYKVYNLCSERSYDPAKFEGRVACYPFDDHNAPPFELIKPFCEDVEEFLTTHDNAVAAIHCKAGKGRTGVMISAYLLHKKLYTAPLRALKFYGMARTHNAKGVTIPSQRRFVAYYSYLLNNQLTYKPATIFFRGLTLNGIPRFEDKAASPYYTIRSAASPDVVLYESMVYNVKNHKSINMMTEKEIPLCADIKIEVFHKKKVNKLFHCWINTFFHNGTEFTIAKDEIDKINKDKKHKVTDADFTITMHFSGDFIREDSDKAGKIDISNNPCQAAAACAKGPGTQEKLEDEEEEREAKSDGGELEADMERVSVKDKKQAKKGKDSKKKDDKKKKEDKKGTKHDRQTPTASPSSTPTPTRAAAQPDTTAPQEETVLEDADVEKTPVEKNDSEATPPTDEDLSDDEGDQDEWKKETEKSETSAV